MRMRLPFLRCGGADKSAINFCVAGHAPAPEASAEGGVERGTTRAALARLITVSVDAPSRRAVAPARFTSCLLALLALLSFAHVALADARIDYLVRLLA